jgi:lysozyme
MLLAKYDQFLLETYKKEFDMINESNTDLKSKFVKLLKLIVGKGYKYRRKLLVYGLSSLIAMTSISEVSNLFASDESIQNLAMDGGVSDIIHSEIERMVSINPIDKIELLKSKSEPDKPLSKKSVEGESWLLRDINSGFILSQSGWDYIRYEEGSTKEKGKPVLTAYSIGDGMITIGWGHAESDSVSQYKIGDKITYDKAQKLLKKDLRKAADGVRRILKRFEKSGLNVKISQDQFDVLVSLAYNSGVGALNRSEIMKHIKKGDLEGAGGALKSWRVGDKFPGLQLRRDKEYEKFMSYKKFD